MNRRTELLIRQRRDTLQELEQLDAGELWHVLSDAEYRNLLLSTLADIDDELEEGG